MNVDRRKVTVIRKEQQSADEPHHMTETEALLFVWELTKEVYALTGKHDVESRLRRDIVTVSRIRERDVLDADALENT